MRGIVAAASMSSLAETSIAWVAEGMKCLSHRGPDDKGKWISSSSTIALGHCRLSVIDLSSGGHQPIVSTGGSCVLTFNGEVNRLFAESPKRLLLIERLVNLTLLEIWRKRNLIKI